MFKKIYIEITNSCNLNCTFCNGNKREKKFLTKEDFTLLLDKLEGYTSYLYFHVMGEPLLHPAINEMIQEASKRYFINITTNGYLIDRIKDNPFIRQINISLHSYDPKYKIDMDIYLQRIFCTVKKLVSYGTKVNYRLWVKSTYSASILKALEKEYGVLINGEKNVLLAPSIYFTIDEEFIWPSLSNSIFSEKGSCMGCRTHIGVLVDGTVIPCCLDSEGIISLGNIYKQDLDVIINGSLFKEIKKGFQNNKKIHPLCKTCHFYSLRNKENTKYKGKNKEKTISIGENIF